MTASPEHDRPRLAFLDVEASGLIEQSYPLEIGWAVLGGAAGAVLIKPAADWSVEAWDEIAADRHGLDRQRLLQTGLPVDAAAETLSQALAGRMLVLTDAVEWDRYWIDRLFDATALTRSFELADYWRALALVVDDAALDQFRRIADSTTRPHRAQADAELLRHWWLSATTPSTPSSPT